MTTNHFIVVASYRLKVIVKHTHGLLCFPVLLFILRHLNVPTFSLGSTGLDYWEEEILYWSFKPVLAFLSQVDENISRLTENVMDFYTQPLCLSAVVTKIGFYNVFLTWMCVSLGLVDWWPCGTLSKLWLVQSKPVSVLCRRNQRQS